MMAATNPPKRQRRGGGNASKQPAAALPSGDTPDGPSSMAESDLWPEGVLESLKASGLLGRLVCALEGGLHVSSDYSGLGTVEEALKSLCQAVTAHCRGPSGQAAKPCVQCQRAGDLEEDCRTVLLAARGSHAPECVHGDIGERCDAAIWEDMQERIAKLQNSELARLETDPVDFAKAMFEMVMTQDLSNVASYCYKHRKKCPLKPEWRQAISPTATDLQATSVGETAAGVAASQPPPPFAAGSAVSAQAVQEPSYGCAMLPDDDIVKLHSAGFNCYDWSAMGAKKGWYGASTPAYMQWLAERKQFGEEIVIGENTLNFDVETQRQMVADTHTVDCIQVSPSLFGEPIERQRLYIVMLRKNKRRWARHMMRDMNLQDFFNQVFARKILMCVDDKFRAPQAAVQEYVSGLADAQRLPPTTSSGKPWSCYLAMSSAARAKVQGHQKKLEEIAEQKGFALNPEEVRNWTANLSQTPDFMPPARGKVGAMLQHTNLWLFSKKRLALPLEHLEIQGWNLFGGGPYKSDLISAVGRGALKDNRLKSMAGNGMHLQVVAAVIAFTLACTERET